MDLLRIVLEADGYRVITVNNADLRAGRVDLQRLTEQYPFDVVVFDVALPYQANWELYVQLRDREWAHIPVILTTTNERAVSQLIGEPLPELLELWGKPYDLGRLRARVRAVLGLPERRQLSEDRRERRGFAIDDRRSDRDDADDRSPEQRPQRYG